MLCWLALGAVVNVAVEAVNIFWLVNRPGSPHLTTNSITEWPSPTYADGSWPKPATCYEYSRFGWTMRVALPEAGPTRNMIFETWGWPARWLRTVKIIDGGKEPPLEAYPEGWPLYSKSLPGTIIRVLPTHFLASEFALNTVFFGSLPALWYVPSALRRWHRRRHHLCIHCSYPVADPAKPCSECGRLPTTR